VKDKTMMQSIRPQIEESWKIILKDEFQKEYFSTLKLFLIEEKKTHTIYPQSVAIFNAFNLCPFNTLKVVIIGQDPYHGEGQAHGLSFSVPEGIKPPPSLKNIFKELNTDVNFKIPTHGNLSIWAKQGVLLLNATLTVRKKQAGSHQKRGWEKFTNSVIQKVSEEKEGIVFLLWGRFAQDKAKLIDENKHYILTAPHPSPFSAYSGFFGCKHFSKTNNLLKKQSTQPINWQI
jgi:uracil-DNA glycosylase